MTYMTNKKRLSQHQSGNKKLHSCETLNVMITDKALEAVNAKKVTAGTSGLVEGIRQHRSYNPPCKITGGFQDSSSSDLQSVARRASSCKHKKKFLCVHYFWAVLYRLSMLSDHFDCTMCKTANLLSCKE